MKFSDLIGKKVAALRGFTFQQFGKPHTPIRFMLFDDGETYMEFTEQDQYDYHDCNSSARCINIWQDAKLWKRLMDKDGFDEADGNFYSPF